MDFLNLFTKGNGEQATLSGDEQDTLAKIEADELRAQIRAEQEKIATLQADLNTQQARREKAEASLKALESVPKAATPEQQAAVLNAERTRLTEICQLAYQHGASEALLTDGIFSGMSKDDFAIALVKEQAAQKG